MDGVGMFCTRYVHEPTLPFRTCLDRLIDDGTDGRAIVHAALRQVFRPKLSVLEPVLDLILSFATELRNVD